MNHIDALITSEQKNPDYAGIKRQLIWISWSFAVLSVGVPFGSAWAQDDNLVPIRVGDSKIYPDVKVEYIRNDNAFLTNTDETDTTAVIVSPQVRWVASRKSLTLNASYTGEFGSYSESSLDFTDHNINLSADSRLAPKLSGLATLGFGRSHEALGTNLTVGSAGTYDEQVTYNDLDVTSRLRYGSEGARGNLEAGITYADHTPTSLESIARQTEYSLIRPFVGFSLRVSSDTRLLTELRFSSYDYVVDTRDRTDLELLVGAAFAPTGKLSGRLLLGVSQADFDLEGREDTSELVANTVLTYVPVSYASFHLQFIRDFDNIGSDPTNTSGAQSVHDLVRLSWRHAWSERVSHIASASRSSYERQCPGNNESTTELSLEANVAVKRWLDIGTGVSTSSRSYDLCADSVIEDGAFDYDRTVVGVHLRATL